MGYKVKWVEDNLGVTRKALRGFEEAGLMPKNIGRQYRDYDEDDIDRIWTIRVLQGMGYKLKEIVTNVFMKQSAEIKRIGVSNHICNFSNGVVRIF